MEHLISKVVARAGQTRTESTERGRRKAGGGRLLAVGVGSAGCAATQWVFEDAPEASTLTVNTDRVSLELHKSDRKLLLGERIFAGKSAQGHADAARRAARESVGALGELLDGFDIVVVMAALGGGTGTGAAPIVAATARAKGAAVVLVAALPLRAERNRRERALAALPELKREAHTTILLDNEALLPIAGNLPMSTALGVMDYFMAEVPRALVRVVELAEGREEAERQARELVLGGGLGTLVYGEWSEDGAEPEAQHALVEAAGGAPNGALVHIHNSDGRAPPGSHGVVSSIARRLKALQPPPHNVRLTVGRDPAILAGGSLVSVVLGIADPCAGARDPPGVVLEPCRVLGAPMPTEAREAPPAAGAAGAPAVGLVTRKA
jgi:cell division GTPase FtsZ